jgi:LPS-assembly protein
MRLKSNFASIITNKITLMQRRLFLLFLSALPYASESVANSAAWNCEQSKDGKEWVCDGDSKSPESSPKPISETPISVEPPAAVEIENVAPVVEITNPEPIVSSPVEKVTAEKEFVRPMPVTQKAESSRGLSILPAAFDATQEQTFNVLKSQLKIDPWEHCINPNAPKQTQIRSNKGDRIHAPINVKSNYSEIFENEISSYFGNVRIDRADQQMSSNAANYDSVTGKLDAQGDVYYSDDDMAVHTDAASFDLASDQAKLRDVLFIAPSVPLRGYAGAAYRDSKTVSHYQDVAYTSCPTGNQDWVVHAGELKIDKEDGRGSAKNAWLEFKGTPVFYSPYLSFPTDSRRTSGFLAPSFGSTQRSGFNISTPYYFNIADNYDATFRPRYLTKRGILLAGESRYLTENSYGQLNAEILPNDYLRQDKPRYFASFKDTTKFTDKIQANVDLNFVSDKNYFAELGSALSMPNFSYLKSQADVGYYGDEISAVGRVENYQSIDKALTKGKLPYRKLPQINVNLKHGFDQLPVPVNVAMENEFVYFQHTSLRNGQRSNLKPSISLPMQSASAYVIPKIAVQYTNYFLSDPQSNIVSSETITPNPPLWAWSPSNILGQVSRTLPIFSTDSGMTFERNLNLGGKDFLNTLEPRLFYLYIPRKNQDAINTMFDTATYDMWFNTLFRENRFSGIDRMQDANQITTAITSRLIDEQTGKERAKFSLGNIFYFQNREIQVPYYLQNYTNIDGKYVPVLDAVKNPTYYQFMPGTDKTRFSNIIGELSARINDHVAIDSGVQYDPYQSEISRGKAMLHLTNQPNEILNLGYRYRKMSPMLFPNLPNSRPNDIIQSDISFHYPIYDNWSAIGRWQYSLLYNSTQESFFGVEKENCCWKFRVVGRRYLNNLNVFASDADVQGTSQTGVFFQVELKGLTGMGEKLDTFLEQNIYGYRSTPSY